MALVLLDTDAIIDYLVGFVPTVELVQGIHQAGDPLCVCDVVVAEVYSGLLPKDRAAAEKLLSACTFLSTTPPASQQAGEWRYTYARRGKTLSTTDALIAAVAHAHRASLLTGNRADYPMPELTLLDLERPGPTNPGK